MKKFSKIGLLAGSGRLPIEIIQSCLDRGVEVYVIALQSFADTNALLGAYPSILYITARIGEVGKMMEFLKANGVEDVVLAGGLRRPSLREIIPDWEAVKMLTRIALKKQGDDGVLRDVMGEIERLGFHIVGVDDVAPELIFQEGLYTRAKPSPQDMEDIRRGIEVAQALGRVDVGQSVAVQEGIVLAVEAIEGTDAMLDRAAGLKRAGKKPVMVKFPKPGQDRRVDLPAIGPTTIEQLARHGMGGLALGAGGVLIIDKQAVIYAADAAGIFIIGVKG